MSRHTPHPLVAALAPLWLLACHTEAVRADAPPVPAAAGTEVVATVGGEHLTAAELDAGLAGPLRQLEEKYARQRFDLRRERLDQRVDELLLAAEARKRGLSVEALLEQEVDAHLPRPSARDVQQLFDANVDRLPAGTTLEQARPQLVLLLQRTAKQERLKALLARLRQEHYVRVRLPRPRTEVEARGPSQGPEDAKVTIVEFMDLECPYCARAHATLEAVMAKYEGKVRRVFRSFPLDFHSHAFRAAEAALCAEEQGRFWEYQALLLENQRALEEERLTGYAQELGLDGERLGECLRSGRHARRIQEDVVAGQQAGVTGTPAYFINGVLLSGAQPLEAFERLIDEELAAAAQQP